MLCDDYRQALSARLDGEEPGTDSARLDEHLAGCAGCRNWLTEAVRVTRLARIEPADDVPDLTHTVLERVRGDSGGAVAARWLAPIRIGLVAVAAAQWAAGLAVMFADRVGAALPVHGAHELGAFNLALAVGFAYTAWKPARARAHLPLLGCLAGVLVLLTVVDLVVGHATLLAEAGHLPILAGLALTAALARDHVEPGPPPPLDAQSGDRDTGPPPRFGPAGFGTLSPGRLGAVRARDPHRDAA